MNRFNILTQKLPETVMIGGAEYRINSGFRTGIRFEILMKSELTEEEKIIRMAALYYPTVPSDFGGAINAAIQFFAGGEKQRIKEDEPLRRNKELCSFSQDAPYIYAAFLQQYGINLQRIPEDGLHWWEFLALFEALDDDTLIRKIMYYRGASTSGMSAKQRKQMIELKKRYKLEDDTPVDAKAALAKRNTEMKDYIKRRMRAVNET